METNQATEHLQVIRTLMERSALYRRALAPIMIYCGAVGIIAGIAGWQFQINSINGFIAVWYGSAFLALAGSLLLVRRQAFKDSEPFWSAPTKRVGQAMLPPLVFGMVAGILFVSWVRSDKDYHFCYNNLIMIWAWLYGCALHSAGFSISRGIRLLGWIYGGLGCVLLADVIHVEQFDRASNHLTMGGLFGGLHLLCGIYLYFTENRKTAP